MYRLLIETLLGANLEGDQLRLSPRLPKSWPSYKIHYRYRQTVYHITIIGIADLPGENQLVLDGNVLTSKTVPLVDDRREHFVELKVSGPPVEATSGASWALADQGPPTGGGFRRVARLPV